MNDLDELGRETPLVVGRPEDAGEGAPQDEGSHPLGEGGREQDRQRSPFGDPDHDRRLDTCGIGDRPKIVHAVFGAAGAERPVGTPGAALVEEHEAADSGEATEDASEVRQVPHHLDVRDETGDEEEVEWAVADDLVGDAQLAALGVLGLVLRGHRDRT